MIVEHQPYRKRASQAWRLDAILDQVPLDPARFLKSRSWERSCYARPRRPARASAIRPLVQVTSNPYCQIAVGLGESREPGPAGNPAGSQEASLSPRAPQFRQRRKRRRFRRRVAARIDIAPPTPSGRVRTDFKVVETKLFRNPDARSQDQCISLLESGTLVKTTMLGRLQEAHEARISSSNYTVAGRKSL